MMLDEQIKKLLQRVEIVLSEGLVRSEKEVCDLLDAANMNHAIGVVWAEVCEVLREQR